MEDKRKHLTQVKLIILLWSCSYNIAIYKILQPCPICLFKIGYLTCGRWMNTQFSTWKQVQILYYFIFIEYFRNYTNFCTKAL